VVLIPVQTLRQVERSATNIWYDDGMFRFSLSTLLVCIFVTAVVLSFCMNVPVEPDVRWGRQVDQPGVTYGWTDASHIFELERRSPTKTEIYWRLAWAVPLALITTLLAIQAVRRIWRSIPHKSKAALSDLR
jgi:hypothetical protein